jgi:transcriptional regulator with XRE-family HTH domain
MGVLDTNRRIRQLMDERNWTEYRLAKESGLSQSTIANLYKRNTIPGIATLEAICKGFGITLAQFFCEGNTVELTDEQKTLFDRWVTLTKEQKQLLMDLIGNMK